MKFKKGQSVARVTNVGSSSVVTFNHKIISTTKKYGKIDDTEAKYDLQTGVESEPEFSYSYLVDQADAINRVQLGQLILAEGEKLPNE